MIAHAVSINQSGLAWPMPLGANRPLSTASQRSRSYNNSNNNYYEAHDVGYHNKPTCFRGEQQQVVGPQQVQL